MNRFQKLYIDFVYPLGFASATTQQGGKADDIQNTKVPSENSKAQLLPIHKWSFWTISALCSKNNPRNINYMPAVIFFACLDLEKKSSSMDGH